jgi:hypothetical protein
MSIDSVTDFVEGEARWFVREFVEKNWRELLKGEVVAVPSAWYDDEDVKKVTDRFFKGCPEVWYYGYCICSGDVEMSKAKALSIRKKEGKKCLWLLDKSLLVELEKTWREGKKEVFLGG